MKNDKLDSFIHDNAEAIFDDCNLLSADHKNKFALKLGAASHPRWYELRINRMLGVAVVLLGVFLIVNNKNYIAAPVSEAENYTEVANYFIGDVNNRIDSLIKKASKLDPESKALIIGDLVQMKEENNNMMRKNPKYNVDAFEAAVMAMSERQNEALNTVERMITNNNN